MNDYARFERTLSSALEPSRRPIAIGFRNVAPDGVEKFVGTQPSSCSFWRLAASGRVFYTVPADHYNCPVGSYIQNFPLPPDRESELTQMLSLMTGIGYIRMEEMSSFPRLPAPPGVAIYSPLAEAPVDPDVVIVAGTPARAMLLHEAVTRARGVTPPQQETVARASRTTLPMLGRPTCMAIPAAMVGSLASSLGCVGNRVYTGVSDDEYYTVIAGRELAQVVEQLTTVVSANATLAEYHRGRRATLSSM
jgi:uncharacterized protein (DUF169 family)